MSFPKIWLAQNNMKKFKGGNITQYLILEGLDAVGKTKLLADPEVSSLVETPYGVGMHVWCF
jgi:hypothetical protein